MTANPETRREASRRAHAKRTESGLKKCTFWLSPEAQLALARLVTIFGSKDEAIRRALVAADKRRHNDVAD